MALGFNKFNHDNIKQAKQSKPKRNFATAVKQHKQHEANIKQPKKNKDLTPVTTMKVNKDSLMKLSALQTLFFMNTRTEAFNKIMTDVVNYYIQNHKINKTNFNFLYKMYMKRK